MTLRIPSFRAKREISLCQDRNSWRRRPGAALVFTRGVAYLAVGSGIWIGPVHVVLQTKASAHKIN